MKKTYCLLICTILILFGCVKTSNSLESKEIVAWGDSLTQGSHSVSFTKFLSLLYSLKVLNEGIAGETSTEIKNRMVNQTDYFKQPVIIWAGRNNYGDSLTVLSDIATMVNKLYHSHYIILGILNGDNKNEVKGHSEYNKILAINNKLSTLYGQNYVDIRSYLVSKYNPKIATDVKNFNDDVVPSSLRNDYLHLNDLGNSLVAKKIHENMNILLN